jgi:hypothetical protein
MSSADFRKWNQNDLRVNLLTGKVSERTVEYNEDWTYEEEQKLWWSTDNRYIVNKKEFNAEYEFTCNDDFDGEPKTFYVDDKAVVAFGYGVQN